MKTTIFTSIFEDTVLYDRFEAELFEWLGTPYKHFTMIKGRGADCCLFMMGSLKEAGFLTHVNTTTYYSRDWWRHGGGEFIKDSVLEHILKYAVNNYKAVWIPKGEEDKIQPGDLLGFSFSKTGITHHCGVMLRNGNQRHMIHSINMRVVEKTPYVVWWENNRTGLIRMIRGDG